jgi:class 3 adenylate cyclase
MSKYYSSQTFKWQIQSSALSIWPFISDTERFNQAIDLPPVIIEENELEDGRVERFEKMTLYGMNVRWKFTPYNWIYGQIYTQNRVYTHGPFKNLKLQIKLIENDNGTLISYKISYIPRNFFFRLTIPLLLHFIIGKKMKKLLLKMDASIQRQEEDPYAEEKNGGSLDEKGELRRKEIQKQLEKHDYDRTLISKLSDFICTSNDMDLRNIRPFVCASSWKVERIPLLELFLAATKFGLLSMQWTPRCPMCRGASFPAAHLRDLDLHNHCPTCDEDYEANLSKNVELTFSPHKKIRLVNTDAFCMASPKKTPHVFLSQSLPPRENRSVPSNIPDGYFRIRTRNIEAHKWPEFLFPQGNYDLCIQIHEDNIKVDIIESDNEIPKIAMENHTDVPLEIMLEDRNWDKDAATGIQVTTLQKFRDLFSDEVVKKNEMIKIEEVTILFSDLRASTAMYNKIGDASAFSLVLEQFDFLKRIVRKNEGALVKTLGDAIMAAFADPKKALEAALEIQREIASFNESLPEEKKLVIKLGINNGPCIAVNLNNNLDYFGTAVNLAARLEGKSLGGDVAVSANLLADPEIKEFIYLQHIEKHEVLAPIKGFDEEFTIFRLTWPTHILSH